LDSKSKVLIKAVGGDGVNGTVRNIKFGEKIHRKVKFIKRPVKNKLRNIHLRVSQGLVFRWIGNKLDCVIIVGNQASS